MSRHGFQYYWEADDYQHNPRIFRALEFLITTHCNLKCPECGVNVPGITHPGHYSIEYIQHAASCFFGIEYVAIGGGEPTIHPLFRQIKLKEWFGCQVLALITNGYKVIEYADLLDHFDEILLSHYPQNQKATEFLTLQGLDSRPPGPTLHLTTARRAKRPAKSRSFATYLAVYGEASCMAYPLSLQDHHVLA